MKNSLLCVTFLIPSPRLPATSQSKDQGPQLMCPVCARPGTAVRAVIDEGPFRARFAGQAGLDARVAGRLDGWRQVLTAAGITPLALNLSQPFDEAAVQRIEGGLLADGELRG